MFFPTAPGAHLRRCFEEDLQLGVRKYDGANIAAFHHNSAARAATLLLGYEYLAHTGNSGKARRCLRHLCGADFVCDLFAVEEDAILQSGGFLLCTRLRQFDMRFPRERLETWFVVEWDLLVERFQRHGAIHRAAIQIQVPEHRGDAARDAALARSCWPVDRDGESLHFSGAGTPVCAVQAPASRQPLGTNSRTILRRTGKSACAAR